MTNSNASEPPHEKTGFLHNAKTKTQISFAVTAKLISTFVFATRIVQSLYILNPKFQGSSLLLWLYSPVCVRPTRKPRRPFFSQCGSSKTCRLELLRVTFMDILQLNGPPSLPKAFMCFSFNATYKSLYS